MKDWLRMLSIKLLLTIPAIFIGVLRGLFYMVVPLYDVWTEYKRFDKAE